MNTHHIDSVVTLLNPQPAPRRRAFNIGLHIPGQKRQPVTLCDAEPAPTVLRELIESPEFSDTANNIPLALGVQEDGCFLIPDLAELPHLLVAGHYTTEISAARCTLLLSLHLHRQAGKLRLDYLNGSTDPAGCISLLQEAAREALNRVRFLTWAGVESVDAFNTRTPETMRMPNSAALLPERMERRVILLHDPGQLLCSAFLPAPFSTPSAESACCRGSPPGRNASAMVSSFTRHIRTHHASPPFCLSAQTKNSTLCCNTA